MQKFDQIMNEKLKRKKDKIDQINHITKIVIIIS